MSQESISNSWLKLLGIDPADLQWQDIAACSTQDNESIPLSYFFEDYESNVALRNNMDSICLTCPVQKECFQDAQKHNDSGLRGGFYFVSGQVDRVKNSHKTEETVKRMAERIYDNNQLG